MKNVLVGFSLLKCSFERCLSKIERLKFDQKFYFASFQLGFWINIRVLNFTLKKRSKHSSKR
ncbi:hypothetical protein BpHYR1_045509 [Brachionus plicatilis]|uniref:Uncharacterized protein n=1 Tax=Brachionus plicatilis TaxID=10195 RepID=A0A3M7PHJ6_BRAPC|nr:hypothetical protein BpHYR1_045509 [Brachionus plicatilis]